MEDKCVICGRDVSDLGTHVCVRCLSENAEVKNKNIHKDFDKRRKCAFIKWLKENFLIKQIPNVK